MSNFSSLLATTQFKKRIDRIINPFATNETKEEIREYLSALPCKIVDSSLKI